MAELPTIKEIQEMVATAETELQTLRERRQRVAAELEELEAAVASLRGGPAGARAKVGRPTRRAADKEAAYSDAGSGKMKLSEAILQVLQGASDPVSAREVADGLAQVGYSISAKNPARVVAMTLGKMKDQVTKTAEGFYSLAE